MFFFFAGPGPVASPTVSGLHARRVTVTWVPPSQPNGIITNYTLYLCPEPSSVSSTILDSSLDPKISLLPITEGVYANSGHNPKPTSSRVTSGSGHISMLTFTRGTNGSSMLSPESDVLSNPNSSFRPDITENKHIVSSFVSNTSQGHGSISVHSTETSISSLSPEPSPYNPDYNGTNSKSERVIKQDILLSSSFSDASDSSSVTVPGNTTRYTVLNLLPFHTYSLQVFYIILFIKWESAVVWSNILNITLYSFHIIIYCSLLTDTQTHVFVILQNVGGSLHQCGLLSVWETSALSDPSSSPWRDSCTSPLLWHPHLCPLVLGCTRLEQWTAGAVRNDYRHFSSSVICRQTLTLNSSLWFFICILLWE